MREIVDGGDPARSRGGRAAPRRSRLPRRRWRARHRRRASVVHHSSTSSCSEHLTAAARHELVPRLAPLVAGAGEHERAQEVVQVVGRRRLGLDLGVHLLDGFRLERADRREVDRQATPQRDRVGAPVLELLVVEERVRARGEDLVREHRRFGGLGEVDGDVAVFDALEQRAQRRRRRGSRRACR